jgi:Tol biopolymer transport system component
MARRTRIQGWFPAAAVIAALLAAPAAADAALAGANGRIYFSALAPGASVADVWSVNPDGTGLTNLTDLPGGPGEGHDPSAAPNGLVAFAVGTGTAGEIWAMNADGSSPRRLTNDGFADRMPAVSPDGARIAFASGRGGPTGADLWTMAADGSDQRPLLTGFGEDLWPQYSADGEHVVLATNAAGNFDIAYVTVADAPLTSAIPTTSRSPLDETEPAIQPSLARMGYTQSDPANPASSDIQTAYSNDGTDEYPLAVDPARSERSPAFSPDGTEVVYIDGGGLVTATAGGLSPTPLAIAPASSPADPDWAVGPPVDRTPPETRITKAPKPETKRKTARFRFESSEAGSTFACRLDRGKLEPCDSPHAYRDLEPGRHRLAVTATDAAGNSDPSPAVAQFTIRRAR